MFETEMLLGDTSKSIVLQTRKGRAISNEIAVEPGQRERNLYEITRNRLGQQWVNRKSPCGVYNCFGMVFASRRVAIRDTTEIDDLVYSDDGYRKITEGEAMCGDIVIYRERRFGMVHAARITRRDQVEGGSTGGLFALSKWNDTFGEDSHHVQHHCWHAEDGYEIDLEYWTDRQP